jgi:hypothetical protein
MKAISDGWAGNFYHVLRRHATHSVANFSAATTKTLDHDADITKLQEWPTAAGFDRTVAVGPQVDDHERPLSGSETLR